MSRLILIWGVLIAIYLLVSNANGASSVVNSLGNFVGKTTGILQGRGTIGTAS